MIYDVAKNRSIRVLSLAEADPGSGLSFGYHWSRDSAALAISGACRGFEPYGGPDGQQDLEIALVYQVATDELYSLSPHFPSPR